MLGLIRERLSRPDAAKGFILDGFPRNSQQASALSGLLEECPVVWNGGPPTAFAFISQNRQIAWVRAFMESLPDRLLR